MFRIKILLLLLPLAINVKAVELINERYGNRHDPWYDNSSPTPYSSNKSKEYTTPTFRPVPLRHVPKPITFGSFGIPKAAYTTLSHASGQYNYEHIAAPQRLVSSPSYAPMKETTSRQLKPRDPGHEVGSYNHYGGVVYNPPTPVASELHYVENKTPVPRRHVPKYEYYVQPRVPNVTPSPKLEFTEFATHPATQVTTAASSSRLPVTPSRYVANPTTIKPSLTVNFVEVKPQPEQKELAYLNNGNQFGASNNLRVQYGAPTQKPKTRPVEGAAHYVETITSPPRRPVPSYLTVVNPIVTSTSPRPEPYVTEFVTHPSTEKSRPQRFTKLPVTTPYETPNDIFIFKNGAPLRLAASSTPKIREEPALRENIVEIKPKPQFIELKDRNYGNPGTVENIVHFDENKTPVPLRHVPKYVYYAEPVKNTTPQPKYFTEYVTYPSTAKVSSETSSKLPSVVLNPTTSTPYVQPSRITVINTPTEPTFKNEKIVVTVMPQQTQATTPTTPFEVEKIVAEDLTPATTPTPHLPSITGTTLKPLKMSSSVRPVTHASILEPHSLTVTRPTITPNHPNEDPKELRLDFTCDGINAFYGVAQNCDKFVECKDDIAKLYRCPPGLHFNAETVWPAEPCEDKYVAGCDKSLVPAVISKPNLTVIALHLEEYDCSKGDGYYGIENSCGQFVECKNNDATLYGCPQGWHYNRHARYGANPCDIPKVAQCNKKPAKFSATIVSRRVNYLCPINNGYFRIANECDQFIKCENSIASSYKCFEGLQFDERALYGKDPCSSASQIRCHAVVIPPPAQPQFSAVLISRIQDYPCHSSNGYYSLENDCEQFVKCENSVASMYRCLPGLQYNYKSVWGDNPCESESIVRCRAKNILPEPKFSADFVARMESSYFCPQSTGYFGIENDCENFIKCENSIALKYKCFSGFQYNRNAKWEEDPCASASIVRCQPLVVIPPAPTNKFSAVQISTMYSYHCSSSNEYIGVENECDQFVKCERFIASRYKCNPGLQFNPNVVWGQDPCVSESLVQCHAGSIVVPRPPPPSKFSADLILIMNSYNCPSSNGYYNFENDCEHFIKCEQSVASQYKCRSELQFNHNAAWGEDPCASASIVRCSVVVIPPAPKFSAELISRLDSYSCPSSDGYYKIENDCEEFVKCEAHVPSKYKCHAGLQYNPNAVWGQDPCASESVVRCYAVIVPPAPKFSAVLIGRLENYACPSSQGYYNQENSCEAFVKCERFIAYSYKCSAGLQFNHNAVWGQDPCESETVIRCRVPPPPPKFSATLIATLHAYVCPEPNGYYRLARNDCEQFVKCEGSVAFSYKCHNGLQYNQHAPWGQDPCAAPEVASCEIEFVVSAILITPRVDYYTCSKANGYFAVEGQCEQFIECKAHVPSKYKCHTGLQYNPNAVWGQDPCASESVVRCYAVIVPPAPKFSAVFIGRLENYACPSSQGYYNQENSCEAFVKCERFIAYSYKCSAGLQFNHNAVWGQDPCESETVIRCRVPPPPPKFSATLIATLDVYVCPEPNGYYRLARNDCEQFVKCEGSVAFSYKCHNGLQYNQHAPWGQDPCAAPEVASCEIEFVVPAILITPRVDYYTCSKANGYFAVEGQCEQFIECKHNVPALYKCPAGGQFNPRARWTENPCASADVVGCQVYVKAKSYVLIAQHVAGFTCSESNGYYSVKDQCEQFIECQNYVPSKYMCKNGLHFNRFAPRGADPCALKSVARCDHNSGKLIPPGPIDHDLLCPRSNGYFPLDNSECSKYVVCENGVGTIMPCPPGLVFNATLEGCDWPVNVPSCNPDVFRGFVCPETHLEISHYKYGDSCNTYIACQEGRPRLLSCDPGKSFDEESKHCIDSSLVHNCRH